MLGPRFSTLLMCADLPQDDPCLAKCVSQVSVRIGAVAPVAMVGWILLR